jgi:glycosyltransferase involved in cell wall biosynthesis
MNTISIVIITKNEEHVLERTLRTLQNITDDLIIVDSGSNDQTLSIAKAYGAKVLQTEWLGYGATKNLGISSAKYDWILSLDADEGVDDVLRQDLLQLNLTGSETVVYNARFKNFIGEVYLKFGKYLKSSSTVLFNKKYIKWDDQLIHEKLSIPKEFTIKKLKGYILHYTMKDIVDYNNKMSRYAILNAQKYFTQGKKVSNFKLFIVRRYTFIRNYFVGLGFLDGAIGFISASIYAHYTFLKYSLLKELINSKE